MKTIKPVILSTKFLDEGLTGRAEANGISIDVLPFIKTEVISSIEVQQEIEFALLESAIVVFTSANAVEAVASELHEQKPDWQIFCIGHATLRLVEKHFGKELIAGTAGNATGLAELIIHETNTDKIIFFCGDQRRNELPGLLSKNNIEVNEIIVYETLATPYKIEKKYDGILFFSPSSVKSFFQKNQPGDQTILFAIGSTTASEIKKNSKNKIVTSDAPTKEVLVEKAINYFKTNFIHH